MSIQDLRNRPEDYHFYLKDNNKAEVHTLAPVYIESGDKLYLRDDTGVVWITVVDKSYAYNDGCGDIYAHLTIVGREATEEEWDATVDKLMTDYDWDWSKRYPKKDTNAWYVMIDNFVHEYMDGVNNYNEEDGIPGSRSSEEVIAFLKFLAIYPDLRFFQALSAWVGRNIYVMDENPDNTTGMKLPGQLHDTFYWEKDSYERRS